MYLTRNIHVRLLTLLCSGAICATIHAGCADDVANQTTDVCTHWEYSGEAGPEHWKECATYAACGGTAQSPVNITGAVPDLKIGEISFSYDSSKTTVLNNGHTLQWNYDTGSSITFDGTQYQLNQYHFHTPAEHTINSTTFSMEAHLVHKDNATGNLVVIGVLFNEGAENPYLQQFISNLPSTSGDTAISAFPAIVSDLLPSDKAYFTYPGSLTTPPCSEIVTWIVMKNPVTASKAQIDAMKAIIHANNRPVHPLGTRTIRVHE
jgi:carbonic anhydrase